MSMDKTEKKDQAGKAPKRPLNSGPTFEDNIDLINELVEKQRGKWTLTSLVSMDWQDISQIVKFHIFRKWSHYDTSKPLGPWVSIVTKNQLSNLIESKYTNFTRPCFRCEAAMGDDGCSIYGQQGRVCPLYERWMKSKGNALATKLPVSLEDHSQEVYEIADNGEDLTLKIDKFHEVILPVLNMNERMVYKWVYIENREDKEVRNLMMESEFDIRYPWHGKLKIIKENILVKAKKLLKEADI